MMGGVVQDPDQPVHVMGGGTGSAQSTSGDPTHQGAGWDDEVLRFGRFAMSLEELLAAAIILEAAATVATLYLEVQD